MSTVAVGGERRTAPLTRRGRILYGVVAVVVVLLLWSAASAAGVLPANVVPGPVDIAAAFGAQLVTGDFWAAIGQTLLSVFIGLIIVLVISTPLSIAMGRVRFIRESLWVVIEFLKPIPPVALIPLTLLLWGISPTMKLFLVVFGALWPLLTQMTYGVREADGVALSMARSYRLGGWRTIRSVIVPSLLPFTATGLRVSAAIALIISVVTEMITGAAGIGKSITIAQVAGQLAPMYALIVTTGLLGLGLNALFRLGERRLLFWHASQREEQT